MFIEDEEKLSDIYSKPTDRIMNNEETVSGVKIEEEKNSIVLDMSKERKVEPSVRDSSREVSLSPDDLEKKAKKKRLTMFILIGIVDVAFFIYIIYLVVKIFIGLANG